MKKDLPLAKLMVSYNAVNAEITSSEVSKVSSFVLSGSAGLSSSSVCCLSSLLLIVVVLFVGMDILVAVFAHAVTDTLLLVLVMPAAIALVLVIVVVVDVVAAV